MNSMKMQDRPTFIAYLRVLAFVVAIMAVCVAIVSGLFTYAFASPMQDADSALVAQAPATSTTASADMYRMYNRNSGEHFYTASTVERDSLVNAGWRYEGVGWRAPETSSAPVYRLYSGTDHHYTTSAYERDSLVASGWRYEGIGWYSEDAIKDKPLYRQFNPNVNIEAIHNNSGSHNYSMSYDEHSFLVGAGWRGEGVAWYAAGEGALLPNTDPSADALRARLNLTTYLQPALTYNYKGADWQGYIVLHDTEGSGDPMNVVDGWLYNGAGVASHFIVGLDGSIVQCVDMDYVAHHAGWGNRGFNREFGVREWPYDGSIDTNYGMNFCSIGIEMVHWNGQGYYPEAQLNALDNLIAYIDAYYGFESTIIDHKMWAIGNSDTSSDFAGYLENYRRFRHH